MHPNEIHHIKAYIVFSILSAISIGVLIYLYYPLGSTLLTSSVVQNQEQATLSSQNVDNKNSGSVQEQENLSSDDISGRRMRLTQILMRAKKELQTLEEARKASPQGLDSVSEQKIIKLKEKIVGIEKMITELK